MNADPPSLRLEIGDVAFRMESPEEFELSLRARLDVRTVKHSQLHVLSDEALAEELDGMSNLETVLRDGLRRLDEDPEALGRFLRRMNPNLISQDNDWRFVIAGLAALDRVYDPYKQVAVRRYLEYLENRLELARNVAKLRLHHRAGRPARRVEPPPLPPSSPSPGRAAPAPSERARRIDTPPPGPPEVARPRQRLLFDPVEIGLPYDRGPELVRLPKGHTVTLDLPPHRSLSMVLGTHRFLLVSGDPFRLIDEAGHDLWVPFGRVVVGRGGHSDVVVDGGYEVVSRQHLTLEVDASGRVELTDVSTYGTFVPGDAIG